MVGTLAASGGTVAQRHAQVLSESIWRILKDNTKLRMELLSLNWQTGGENFDFEASLGCKAGLCLKTRTASLAK